MARVIRSSRAEVDLLEIWSFVAEDSIRAADELLDRIDDACRMLAANPGLGVRREELGPGRRSWPVGDYVIFYRRIEDGVALVRVRHGARDVAP